MALIPAKSTDFINRREVLRAGTYVLAFAARPLWAQDTGQYSRITPLFGYAREVLDATVKVDLSDSDKTLIQYLEHDYYSRRTTLAAARETEIFSATESAIGYVVKIPDIAPRDFPLQFDALTQKSQIEVIRSLSEYKLPIVPPPNLVTPQAIPSLEPGKVAWSEDLYVVIDIILETLGLSFSKDDPVVVLINSDPELKKAVEELLKKITSKQWDDVVPIIERVFKWIAASGVLRTLSGLLARKIGFRLALEAVPIVGWAYLCALFIISVKKNYHRFSFA